MDTKNQESISQAQKGNSTTIASLAKENTTKSNTVEMPKIELPKGGGALKGIDEKFEVNAANGTASFSIPLPATPGRHGFSPSLVLSYNSGGGNSPFGLGWSIGLPSIQRKTDKKIPQYTDEDVFMFSGAEDLVPNLIEDQNGKWKNDSKQFEGYQVQRYRPRIEQGFSRIEHITHQNKMDYWRVTTRENVTTIFGRSNATRIYNPENETQIFQWLPELSYDDRGNCLIYEYKLENLENVPDAIFEKNRKEGIAAFTNQYIKRVKYGNLIPYYAVRKNENDNPYHPRIPEGIFLFEMVFDYGEHSNEKQPHLEIEETPWKYRKDAFSSYRSGFEIRTNRLCERVLMFHHFEEENQFLENPEKFGINYLVRSLDLHHPIEEQNSIRTEVTYLKSITQCGFIRKGETYFKKVLPPIEFEYQELQWNTEIKKVDTESIFNAPVGLTNNYQWADLYGEGISGILTEQGQGWYYKSNYGDTQENGKVTFAPARKVAPRPSFSGLSNGSLSLQDLESNGQKQIVVNNRAVQGYFELTENEDWKPFQPFKEIANLNLQDPQTRLLDVTGDGQHDIVMTEENVFSWYASKGKKGHHPANQTAKPYDENLGPAIVFADQEQSIFLADFSGDGLTDIVRIKNGEVCYWANKGYGNFSAKIEMGNAPYFDHPELFNPKYLHLADVSGTGATDIIYLGQNTFKAFINLSGNAFSDAYEIDSFCPIDSNSKLSVIDLLGSGTSCIVWSSDLPGYADAPMRYIDLMNSKKPHVLVGYRNNMGKETSFKYKSSTHFYIQDKLKGTPWKTKLSFPVQVVSEMIIRERITDVQFTTSYTYHNGYYDHQEREFRGFGRVEQLDTEKYGTWSANNEGNQLEKSKKLYQAPVLTKTWFHTGAFFSDKKLLEQFEDEYWYHLIEGLDKEKIPDYSRKLTADKILNYQEMTSEEVREAHRSCKGMMLRQEVFSFEGNKELHGIPYTVATHNCQVQRLQPRATNTYGVFLNTESEAITFQYERDYTDARIAHTLNTKIDDLGNVLERASVVYPRANSERVNTLINEGNNLTYSRPREKETYLEHLTIVANKQKETLITYTKNSFTQDIDTDIDYRLRQPAATKSYELKGIPLPAASKLYQLDTFDLIFEDSRNEKKYNETINNEKGYRLIEYIVSLFYDKELSKGLPKGEMAAHGMPYEAYQLAFTKEMLETTYGTKINDPKTLLENEGKYVELEPNTWWIPSGYPMYKKDGESLSDVKNRFYSPLAYNSPFDTITKLEYYKNYFLFPEVTIDALENRTEIEQFNFRTLSPIRIKDSNHNYSEVLMDELGLVKAMAVLGKGTEADNLNDLREYTTEAESDQIKNYFSLSDTYILRKEAAKLLQNATTRFVYDFDRYQNSYELLQEQQVRNEAPCALTKYIPITVASIVRERHHQDILNDSNTDKSSLQLSFEYSDGLGNVAMQKTQAEPGEALQLLIKPNCEYTLETVDTEENIRWIGNGRTVLNNKGNPVKQYEPYFSVNPFYEDHKELVERGVTPILYYDALGRNIKTDFPDGTMTKMTFNVWEQYQYDQNDCVEEGEWYQDQLYSTSSAQIEAAKSAFLHRNTPTVLHLDTLGRPILSIEHNRTYQTNNQGDFIDSSAADEYYATLIDLDLEGNVRKILDARGNPVMQYGYDMLGHRIYEKSMDAGERWSLTNVAENLICSWDSKAQTFSTNYDALQRPTEQWLKKEGNANTHLIEKLVYGESLSEADAILKNLKGQSYQHYDSSGLIINAIFDFKGNPLENTRQLPKLKKTEIIDWSQSVPLEEEFFTLKTQYDALNRMTLLYNWHRSADRVAVYKPSYNERGVLQSEVQITGAKIAGNTYEDGKSIEAIQKVTYDEKGQRTLLKLGNNTTTKYQYHPKNFRLVQLRTTKRADNKKLPTTPSNLSDVNVLQNLYYTYDAVGNITEIEDDAYEPVFFKNQQVEPKSQYTYDALNRLVKAKGRENKTFNTAPNAKEPKPIESSFAITDKTLRNYTQTYQYDAVGNIKQMCHKSGTSERWKRNYYYAENSNRLEGTEVGSSRITYNYNAHGSMLNYNNTPDEYLPKWDYIDRVSQIHLGGGGNAYYQYDSQLDRSRKVIEKPGGITEERLYLGGMEVYRRWKNNIVEEEIETHHLMLNDQRVLLIDDILSTNNQQLTTGTKYRYQYSNHLGSVGLEMNDDDDPKIISYEEYHPYGTVAYHAKNSTIETTAKRYRYTGMERDSESGLNYHSARYYLSWLGRWLSADPIGVEGGMNIYNYSINNPIKFSDKKGKQPSSDPLDILMNPKEYNITDPLFGVDDEITEDILFDLMTDPSKYGIQDPLFGVLNTVSDLKKNHPIAKNSQRVLARINEDKNVVASSSVERNLHSLSSYTGFGSVGNVTMAMKSGNERTFNIAPGTAKIVNVVSSLVNQNVSRGEKMTIISLFRHGNDRSLHKDLNAVDISRYAGHIISERNPESSLLALEALLGDLPKGHYAIGLPRLSRTGSQAKMQEDAKVKSYQKDYDVLDNASSILSPTEQRKNMREPFMEASADQIPASNVEEQIRHIKDPNTRNRVKTAVEKARKRGVYIDGLFRDKSNHFHLSIPNGRRM